MPTETKLYEILGVDPDASQRDIKKAYRKLAVKYHPDRAEGDRNKAEEKFKEISHAYDILSDDDKRARYDMFGESLVDEGPDMDDGIDITNLMNQNLRKKVRPMIHKLNITLEDIFKGTTKKIKVIRNIACNKCDASGAKDKNKINICKTCKGKGSINIMKRMGPMVIQQTQTCNKCNRKGKIITDDNTCKECNGKCIVKNEKIFDIDIKAGSRAGEPIILHGEGEFHPDADEAGDIIIVLEQEEHQKFKRKNENLIFTKELSVIDALCGTNFIITHLDGSKIIVKTDKVINPHKKYYIRNVGLPCYKNPTQKGDMIIEFNIIYPDKLDSKKIKKLKDLFPDITKEKDIKLDTDNYYETHLEEYMCHDSPSESDSEINIGIPGMGIPGMDMSGIPGMNGRNANCAQQ